MIRVELDMNIIEVINCQTMFQASKKYWMNEFYFTVIRLNNKRKIQDHFPRIVN
jgi:hypothetical protein